MNNKTLEALGQAADLFGCELKDFRGMTLRDIFDDAEQIAGAHVYWGLWSDPELDATIFMAA